MKSLRTAPFGERIDKLTNSIENALTGESFPTQVRPLTAVQAKKLVKNDWLFRWEKEAVMPDREVFQLNTTSNPAIIHGLISLEPQNSLNGTSRNTLFLNYPMPLTTTRRKFGIEPRELDLVIASPGKLTAKEKAELSAFFRKKKAANSRRPSVVALREQFEPLAPCSKK